MPIAPLIERTLEIASISQAFNDVFPESLPVKQSRIERGM